MVSAQTASHVTRVGVASPAGCQAWAHAQPSRRAATKTENMCFFVVESSIYITNIVILHTSL